MDRMYLFTRQKGEQDLARAEGPKGSPSKKQSFNKDDSNIIPEHKKKNQSDNHLSITLHETFFMQVSPQ